MPDFTQIDRLSAKLKTLRPLNATELKRLREEFIIENTYNSNAIEGNTLTLRETALILQEGVTIAEKPLRDHLEAIGHRDAFEYILGLADADTPLTERAILEIHSMVLMNDAANRGRYRNVPVRIMGARHIPPRPEKVKPQIEQLLTDYGPMKAHSHIIEAVAEFHMRFEAIHPFIDGNGRTGRLIINLELLKAGLLPVNIKFADRQKYYACFDSYFADNNSTALARLITGYEAGELTRYIGILENSTKQAGKP